MLKKCLSCSNNFNARHKKIKFCSRRCYYNSRIGAKQNKDISGKKNPNWKGGRLYDKDGYVMIYKPKHPNVNAMGYMREHRLMMEKKIGRYLKKTEVVHHKNGIRDDNRIKNLKLFTKKGDHDRLEFYKRGGPKKLIHLIKN